MKRQAQVQRKGYSYPLLGEDQETFGFNDWMTPPEIPSALGAFDLDPAAPVSAPFRHATRHYTIVDDGLKQDWAGRVWLNPPYGTQTPFWMRRLAAHGNGIALIFARTETAMFFESVWPKASAIFFFEGRIRFYLPNGTRGGAAGAASVLIAYGCGNAAILKSCNLAGKYLPI